MFSSQLFHAFLNFIYFVAFCNDIFVMAINCMFVPNETLNFNKTLNCIGHTCDYAISDNFFVRL